VYVENSFQVKLLLDLGEVTQVEQVLEAAVAKHPTCMLLWKQRLELMIKTNVPEDAVLKTFKKARKKVPERVSQCLFSNIEGKEESTRKDELYQFNISAISKKIDFNLIDSEILKNPLEIL
jgi:hypothetical protein